MLLKFPQDFPGQQMLKIGNRHFAMLKQRRMAEKRRVFLSAHTLIFVLNGYKLLHTDAGTIKVEAGSVFLLRKGFHIMSDIVEDGTDFKSLIIYITDEYISKFLHKYGDQFPSAPQNTAQLVLSLTPQLESFSQQFIQYFSAAPNTIAQLLPLKLFELLLLLMATPQQAAFAGMLQDIAVAPSLDIEWVVRRHLFEPLGVEELAKLSNRSLAAFKRDFQRQFQTSPRKWITSQRLSYAHKLLLNSNKQVAEIGQECGFEHIPHFISLFRQQYGQTPQAFRSKTAII
ncbi:MAG: helix-turn-helix transcriptional regulator [Chitinophaga sp.]|uniref:helix-turn-helix transcriptional regulator n=1 Tax=Chitinophaga sp. TaxID=1869181 RepID=UPI0025BFE539|nr:helix-turn-helix transcriptional regulator [Chitinophaga sp.]MBV8255649.1 helix-turn-helix transcriptional regulator [Chitinophaga sp.]